MKLLHHKEVNIAYIRCANRPGMAHTNIISRRLNREIVNLGFSGNALLDYEIAFFPISKSIRLIA